MRGQSRKHEEDLAPYELLRIKNVQENQLMMRKFGLLNDELAAHFPRPIRGVRVVRKRLFYDAIDENQPALSSTNKRSEPLNGKPNLKRTLSQGKRRSKRLASRKKMEFSEEVSRQILGDSNSCYVSWGDPNEYCGRENRFIDDNDLEYKKKPQEKYQMESEPDIRTVDEISDDELEVESIAEHVRDKVYSKDGTTCHQCRQKTKDRKTKCNSSLCVGIRGQFCGPCLRNRYGESVAVCLKEPEWTCPPCRKMCNCSICRAQAGKVPTGPLTYLALGLGFHSVKHFLDAEDEN